MTTVLGIDTGGTYTDGVILKRETKEIVTSAKSHTTHENLIEGIRGVIRKLKYDDVDSIDYVALSTTLATNAIVESHGCRVGALILGYEAKDLPPCEYRQIRGSIGLSGKESDPLDEEAIRLAVEEMRDKVDAVAISGIFSVRNPEHELRARAIVDEILSVPVIMAHDLTGTLGVHERTNTAILNAKLISVITDLMTAVKAVMKEKNIDAPLMIVKGDGSLMTEKVAKERPIETILSGPAASIIGATYLNDIDNGLVVDMGGTTTDVAILSDGRPLVTKEGADVGGWRTRVSAVNAYTFGLGGDSYFSRNTETDRWEVGPRRSRPVSVIALEYPYYKQELFDRRHRQVGLFGFGQADGLILHREPEPGVELSDTQRKLIDALKDGPHTVVELGKRVGTNPNFFYPEKLINLGVLGIVGFTPSDVLCALGLYENGDREAAEVAAELIADSRKMKVADFYEDCIAKVREKMGRSLLTCVLERSGLKAEQFDEAAEFYFRHGFGLDKSDFLDVGLRIGMPVVGIGAPIHAWLKEPSRQFGVEPIISKNHEVANAVGAAAGKVMNIYSLTVENVSGEYLSVFAPWGKTDVYRDAEDEDEGAMTIEELVPKVVENAIKEAERRLREDMESQGITHYEILSERKDSTFSHSNDGGSRMFLESKIDVIAVGLPSWTKDDEEEKKYRWEGFKI